MRSNVFFDGASMPRSHPTNAIQELRHNSAEGTPPLESRWIEAHDAGRFRWDSWARSSADIHPECQTCRTVEDQVLMQISLDSVLNSRTTLFSQATWSFSSGGFQRMRTIKARRLTNRSRMETDSTRCSWGNFEMWTELGGTTVPSRPRHDSTRRSARRHEGPRKMPFQRTRHASTQGGSALRMADSSESLTRRALQNQSAHVYLPLGA
jgi:hypothetical protein